MRKIHNYKENQLYRNSYQAFLKIRICDLLTQHSNTFTNTQHNKM